MIEDELRCKRAAGSGTYGSVYTVRDRRHRFCALKVFKADISANEGVPTDVVREIACLRAMDHPSVVQLLEVRRSGATISILLRGFQRNLEEHYRTATAARHLEHHVLQVARGLRHMHARGWYHRDVKPQNIVVNDREHACLVDMGQAGIYRPGHLQTFCVGTWPYRAPEICGKRAYGPGADVWSLGCCVFELVAGERLFGCPRNAIGAAQEALSSARRAVAVERMPIAERMLKHAALERCTAAHVCDALERPARAHVVARRKEVARVHTAAAVAATLWGEQTEIGPRQREILVDWLLEVAFAYALDYPVVSRAVDLLDAMLRAGTVYKAEFQLLGLACLSLASKLEHVKDGALLCEELEYISKLCAKSTIAEMEWTIMATLDYDVGPAGEEPLDPHDAELAPLYDAWLFSTTRHQQPPDALRASLVRVHAGASTEGTEETDAYLTELYRRVQHSTGFKKKHEAALKSQIARSTARPVANSEASLERT
jgi:hypothetical protein